MFAYLYKCKPLGYILEYNGSKYHIESINLPKEMLKFTVGEQELTEDCTEIPCISSDMQNLIIMGYSSMKNHEKNT